MNLDLYKPTDLENWISKRYRDAGIFYASDMDMDFIADLFGAEVHFYAGRSCVDFPEGEDCIILLNGYGRPDQRREEFFHELAHPVRHVGVQHKLPETLIDLFEREATIFQLYAAMPAYMLQEFSGVSDVVFSKVLAEEFCLSEKFVCKRLEQIQNRIYLEEQRVEEIRMKQESIKKKISDEHVRKIMEEYGRRRREREQGA